MMPFQPRISGSLASMRWPIQRITSMTPTITAATIAPIASRSRLAASHSKMLSISRGAAATLSFFIAALVAGEAERFKPRPCVAARSASFFRNARKRGFRAGQAAAGARAFQSVQRIAGIVLQRIDQPWMDIGSCG